MINNNEAFIKNLNNDNNNNYINNNITEFE